ncbi:MAG: DUF3795 domain-containing protein [Oscillospiraceae bacterium]|nr:DUF3795 domain-containing protein [Oscillospiraceae bacterium]
MHKSSYCGINCEKCKVYLATMADDDSLKQEIAKEWSALYKRKFTKEDMVCKGCKSDVLFALCSSCDITSCNKERGIENCNECVEFPCDRYQQFLDYQKINNTGAVFD